MTESKMQVILNTYLYKDLQHKFITPNIHIANWESDLISVTHSQYIREYEIKLSKSDYIKDFKKVKKHTNLNAHTSCISMFYYVIYGFKLEIEDLPEYAGLMIVKKKKYCSDYNIKIIKPAPKISNKKITDRQKIFLYESMYARYWNLSRNINKQSRQLELI